MGGPGRCPRKIKGGRQGKVYEPAFANLNEMLSIPSSKTGCSWRNSWPPSCLQLPWFWLSHSKTLQRLNVMTASVVLPSALCLNHNHFGTSASGLDEGVAQIVIFFFLKPFFHCYTKPSVLQCATFRERLEAFERQAPEIRLFIFDEVYEEMTLRLRRYNI